jgi:hypothetical protein
MAKASRAYKSEWKINLEQWQSSGLTIAAWCQERNIPVHTFYYWRKKLMPVNKIALKNKNSFIELKDKPSSISGISIECCGVLLHLTKDFHSESLIHCLQTLRKI